MTGITEDGRVDVENDGDDNAALAGSDEEGGKKKKTPNLIRLLKTRLQKLVDKTDDTQVANLHRACLHD
jgi:chromatin structure-remodeling complex subunit RSC4